MNEPQPRQTFPHGLPSRDPSIKLDEGIAHGPEPEESPDGVSGLYRRQAMEAQNAPKYGAPISYFPVTWTVLTISLVTVAVLVVAFISLATFSRKEVATGILTLSNGENRIFATKPGVITQIFVREDQLVHTGAALFRVMTRQTLLGGDVLDARVSEAIQHEQAQLNARLIGFDESARLQRLSLEQKIEAQVTQLRLMGGSLSRRQESRDVAYAAYESGSKLVSQGVISGTESRQRQLQYLSQEQSLADFSAQMERLKGDIAQDRTLLEKLPEDQRREKSEILMQIAALDQKAAAAAAAVGYVVTSPIAGAVTGLQAKIGGTTDSTRPILTVVPANSEIMVELYVPSRAIAFIRPGQTVRLMYDAFPYQKFGMAAGRVVEVSSTLLKPEEVQTSAAVKEPVYRVIVIPDKDYVTIGNTKAKLRSGLSVTADIILEEYSFLSSLLEPVLSARERL